MGGIAGGVGATQLALFNKRQAAVREEIGALEQSQALIKAELDMNLPLVKTGDVSRAEILKLQRQAADIQGQITNRRNKYLQDIQTDLVKAQEDLAGLPASVKLDAYDYTVYGTLAGEVIYISADTLNEEVRGNDQPYYRVQIKTGALNLVSRSKQRIDIQPGMTATVEIKTGRNTVLRYLTKPITKTISESLGER